MSTNNGQLANENTFNNAYLSRLTDTNTTGKVDLDETSTTEIKDIQRVINEIADQSGIANQSTTDAVAKVYSSNNVISNTEDQKVSIGKLDSAFDSTAGHDHDGANSKAIDAANLSNVNNLFASIQTKDLSPGAGTSDDVSADFTSQSPGGDSVTEGVITSAPSNRVDIVELGTFREIEDASGHRVYGRITEAASVWTLSYFVNIAGTETAHSLSSQNITYAYKEVFTQFTRPTISADVGLFDSLAAVEDIPDASPVQSGKVTTSAQSFAGVKEFASRPTTNSIDIVDISTAQVITNKDIDGGTATATNRITLPSGTTAALGALPRKEGTVYYSTDDDEILSDDGTSLNTVGGGAGAAFLAAYVKDLKASGVGGGGFTAGADRTRDLNTLEGDHVLMGLTVSSNQFNLPAGTYKINAKAPGYFVNGHQAFLYNVTDAIEEIIGTTAFCAPTSTGITTTSEIDGIVTIATAKDFEIRHRCNTTRAGDGFGQLVTYGRSNVYTVVEITKS